MFLGILCIWVYFAEKMLYNTKNGKKRAEVGEMATSFERDYKNISGTELYNIFKEKCDDDDFKIAVEKVCEFGIDLSNQIKVFFPNYTRHDDVHIRNVCNWMTRLLGDRKDELTAQDAAMLLMAACCHDIGMSVSKEQEKILQKKFPTAAEQREYVRKHHHERVGEHITAAKWKDDFDKDGYLRKNRILRDHLLSLCKSHGEKPDDSNIKNKTKYDKRLCIVLLRLADILDFDSSRAPQSLFDHMGLGTPDNSEEEISQIEWIKNSAGSLDITDNELFYTASYDDPNTEHKVNEYLKWVKQELDGCREFISNGSVKWNTLTLPFKITPIIERIGYEGGDFQITMDQERILDLLIGENLYSDPCVFVRELLQNSIDAILWRGANDRYFNAKKDGKIKITTWYDDESGHGWFRIDDNGTGMNEDIIKKYFLRAGRSYYTSDDFEEERNTYSSGNTYKPISRFGIGILSCFLSNKNNRLEVSTKRYSHDIGRGNAALRLSITGLKGYYALAKEGEQEVSDWQKMPTPSNEDEEFFRTESGTTICVWMDLFSAGDYQTIKDAVDKYVKFPDVKIEYSGIGVEKADEPYVYPTRDDFNQAVARLREEHGDEFPIVCKHPIPKRKVEKIKKHFPEFKWESAPALVLEYFPLDGFASGDNLGGIYVYVDTTFNDQKEAYPFENKSYESELSFDIGFSRIEESIEIELRVQTPERLYSRYFDESSSPKIKEDYRRFKREYSITISYNELYALLKGPEKSLFRYAVMNNVENSSGAIAYNGVLASETGRNSGCKMVLLLNGSYAPQVSVARDTITALPLEAAVELSVISVIEENMRRDHQSSAGKWRKRFTFEIPSDYRYKTEKEICKIIEKHPEWEEIIWNFGIFDYWYYAIPLAEFAKAFNNEKDIYLFLGESLYDKIALTLLKKHFLPVYDRGRISLAQKTGNEIDTSLFPVGLFLKYKYDSGYFCFELSSENEKRIDHHYSPDHRFSQWLIKNRDALEKELPEIYKKILRIMIMSENVTEVMNGLNGVLTQLQRYKNNYFKIFDKLYLTEADFI